MPIPGVRFFTLNWQLKLLSLVVAIVLWAVVVNAEKSETVLAVPVEFRRIPEGLEVLRGRPDTVDVYVRGLRLALSRLSGENLRAVVDLSGARAGESALRLLPEHVRAPFGVQVLRVTPSRLMVVLGPAAPTESGPTSSGVRP
jgi:YbbR domain-containing protein